MIPNALQPAEVDEVILCQMIGKAIVLVRDDQLSLAIGKRGQNVRLASKLCTWDIDIMTQGELEQQIDQAVQGYVALEGVDEELANKLVGEGYLSYDELSVIEPSDLMEMGGITEEQVDSIVDQAEKLAEEAEVREEEEKRAKKAAYEETKRQDAAKAALAAAEAKQAKSKPPAEPTEAEQENKEETPKPDSTEADAGKESAE